VRVRVMQAGALDIETLVQNHGLDFGLTAYRGPLSGVETELIWSIPNVACMAPSLVSKFGLSKQVTWRQLLDVPLAAYPTGFHQRDLMERYARELRTPLNVVLEAENPALIFAAVRAGLAATTLPLAAIESDVDIETLNLPQEEGDQLKIGICWPSDRSLSKAAQTLLDYLKSHVIDVFPR